MQINGLCDDRFAAVREEFERNFSERDDVGATFAATLEGDYVIDLWAGYRDGAGSIPWEEDTIVNVWSTTKTMAALCALVLADRGELDFDHRVAQYWPEYASNGKEETLVRHFMGHTAGLPGFGEKLSKEQLYDWDYVTKVLARQEPWWEPGTYGRYHAITQGFLVGEIVRRITGKSLGSFFRDEIATPLQADFHIGVAPQHFPRIAEILPPPPLSEAARQQAAAAEPFPDRVNGVPAVHPPETNSAAWRQAEIPAANGHGNARSVVRVQTLVANGGSAFGVDLLSEAGCEKIFEEQGVIDGMAVHHGIGYGIARRKTRKLCFWGGAGGSTIMVDVNNRACFSYVMNRMDHNEGPGSRGDVLCERFYECLRSAG